jgi:Zinc carboxypeptidase
MFYKAIVYLFFSSVFGEITIFPVRHPPKPPNLLKIKQIHQILSNPVIYLPPDMRQTFILLLLLCRWCAPCVLGQEKIDFSYYLPTNINYDPAVPTPAAFLGYEVGQWHVSHDQQLSYMRELARTSRRISLREYGRSHENRPLICLTITDPDNMGRLDAIKAKRQALRTDKADPSGTLPVAYMGYSVHGNEASGGNAALLVAYYLAAAQSAEVTALLRNNVILFDPCFNPDGFNRFASWVNSRRSQAYMPDPAHDEFNEPWPGGRTNHYWFDLNRDWLVCQQPESPGRIALFQEWLPNILTDHHEMGSNASFFFQPGVSTRVNPLTPAKNQALTAKIGQYHANILSDKKVLFFTGENYDDYYYGKGSTYPDVQGAIGILFEQGSSRGSAQDTDNGLLTFPYSVRNQVLTSMSTLQALRDMGPELNNYLRDFYRDAMAEAKRATGAGYIVGSPSADRYTLDAFAQMLSRHKIEAFTVTGDETVGNQAFKGGNSLFIPFEQAQYRLIEGMFARPQKFTDSIFYDISTWTLPDAFGLQWTTLPRSAVKRSWTSAVSTAAKVVEVDKDAFAYIVHPDAYLVPRLLNRLLRQNVRVRVAMEPFASEGQQFAAGALLVALDRQSTDAEKIRTTLTDSGCRVAALKNGLTAEGPDLGSANFPTLRQPKVVLVTGRGTNTADVGEVWHLLDTRYEMQPLLVDMERIASLHLNKYNVVVLADATANAAATEKLKTFVADGGVLIATGNALKWANTVGLLSVDFRTPAIYAFDYTRKPYAMIAEDMGAQNLPGIILKAELDLTHPLCFGYTQSTIPMFLGDAIFAAPTKNIYATPIIFPQNPILSGYVHARQKPLLDSAAGVMVGSLGRGRIIGFAGNPNFRAFWYGTNRLFANALWFGHLINVEGTEKKR